LEENLVNWISRLTKTRDELGGFSICPFAKKAMEEHKVFFYYIGYQVENQITQYIDLTPNDFEVICFINLEKNLTDDDLLSIISKLQQKLPQYIFLKDHPDNPGFINGVSTGNGEFPLVLAQPRQKLEEARERLKKTKYYDSWSEEYKQEIWSYGYGS